MPPPPSSAPSADEILALIRRHALPLPPEQIPLERAWGRILREPARAPEDQPAFDRSAFDGFAIRLDDPSTRFRVVDFIRAGQWRPRELQRGEAVQIATGGALPARGLQVVMKEDTRLENDALEILRRDPSRNIRFRGEDARQGRVLVEEGTGLTAGALALLASIGHARPWVTRQTLVSHIATGNEIIPPDQEPKPGQIRDSNTTLVRGFLRQWRIEPRQCRAPEDQALVRQALRDHLTNAGPPDVLLISGGASVGEHDFTRRLLEELGYTIHLARANTRPGKPLIFATKDRALAFGLPGNPLAHFVCLNLFVRAALEGLSGAKARLEFLAGRLTGELRDEPSPRETFWPARAGFGPAGLEVALLRWSSSGDLTCLAQANALARVPPGCAALPKGALVDFLSVFPWP